MLYLKGDSTYRTYCLVFSAELRVFDAKTMSSEPVATVKLPARVPAGFHAIFVAEAELAKQRQ